MKNEAAFRSYMKNTGVKAEKARDNYVSWLKSLVDYGFDIDRNLDDENIEHSGLRNQLNESYDALIKGYGILNSSINRQRILKDEAFGFLILASLERKEGEQFLKADILTQSLFQNCFL